MNQFLFPLSLFLSACLLFIIQPMVAKVFLPVYGGTPAVWTICMLFFQAILLIAYSYAWILSRLKGTRSWRVIHLIVCLVSIIALPLVLIPVPRQYVPELQILVDLLQLGLPLLIVGASAPLLQFAFSQTQGKQAADPYFLYAASNSGSLLALLSYPWLIERFSGINQQFQGWNIIYVLYLGFIFYLLCAVRYQPNTQPTVSSVKMPWQTKASWVFLSFVPCSLMLGVTFYISTDIAATPLFWVLPLALYLLSFVVTFANKPIISHAWVVRNILIFLTFPVLGFLFAANQMPVMLLITANLLGFFMLALLCHGELVRVRPPVQQLTTFYFCLSLGGVLAGCFNGLLAPRLFNHAYEYPLVMLLAILCLPKRRVTNQREWLIPGVVLGLLLCNYYFLENTWINHHRGVEIIALALMMVWSQSTRSLFLSMLILFVFIFMPWFKPIQVLSQQRNFYGVKQVFAKAQAHVLLSQSTIHGFQVMGDESPTIGARAYYGVVYPVVQQLQAKQPSLHAIVLGLGTGIMACQFRQKDKLTIVEIDEQVIDIAQNPQLFTYLRDCPPQPLLIKDDGLLAVKQAKNSSYDLLVMDAFNSDAIPVHLLTLEAFTLYQQKITADGAVMVNMSNRHLRILPVVIGAGRALDMIVLHKSQPTDKHLGQLAAEWALLTTNERLANTLLSEEGWRFVTEPEMQLWTNNYSNLIPLLKW